MKPKDLLKKRNFPSILIYGSAGVGKTQLVSQAKDAYMFDFDDGLRTITTLNDKFFERRNEIEFDTYTEDDPFKPKGWLAAEKKIIELSSSSAKGTLSYKTIIIDSLSGLCNSIQLHVMASTGDPFRKPQIQHWGSMVNIMEKTLTILRSLKCLLLVTAHETNLEVDGNTLIRPLSITQKHSINKLMWLFDECWNMKTRPAGANKSKYIISTRSTSSIAARTRSNLPYEVDITDIGLEGLLKMIDYNEKGGLDKMIDYNEKGGLDGLEDKKV